MSAPDEVVERVAARVLLLDAQDRVLLFHGCDPAHPEAGSWWFTPGGGLDPGESPREAAARELREETGLELAPEALGDVVHVDVSEFGLAGTRYRQTGEFFLARVPSFDIDTAGFSVLEQSFVLGSRWWDPDALRTTSDTVYPEGLADLLARAAGGRWC